MSEFTISANALLKGLNMKKLGLILSFCLAATLAACGGGDDNQAQVAAADTVMAANVQTANFGSCIFAITQSTVPAGHALAVGNTVTVNPCNLIAGTKGLPATGQGANRGLALVLGSVASNGTEVPMSVGAGGQLTINGREVGTITIVNVSGGGS
jgi:hypothetical protein